MRGGNRVFIDEGVLRKERPIVLVVDGDAHLLDLAEDLLAMDDFRVVKAETARTALETLRFRRPDLLVLDLAMPDHEEGVTLIERVLRLFPGSRFPIIGLSGDATADPEKIVRLGVDRFITKPFSVSLLRSAARELLDAYRA
jgi:DNA-binding response OmpR family regulator